MNQMKDSSPENENLYNESNLDLSENVNDVSFSSEIDIN